MNIYLAGPMRGYDELNFPAFRAAAADLRAKGHLVFDPSENAAPDADIRQCMAVDTAWICAHADAVALLPDWEKSRGARAERMLAEAIGIDLIFLD